MYRAGDDVAQLYGSFPMLVRRLQSYSGEETPIRTAGEPMTYRSEKASPAKAPANSVAQDLFEDAMECVQEGAFRRAQFKLRRALAHDPLFRPARMELERLTP